MKAPDPGRQKIPALLPLDVLLQTMRRKWDEGDYDGAVSLARIAAPYLHPKQTLQISRSEMSTMDDEELDALCDRSGGSSASDDCAKPSDGGETTSCQGS